MTKFFSLLCGCFLIAGNLISMRSADRIYFLPFEADSLYPIDSTQIERNYDISSLFQGKANELQQILIHTDRGGNFLPGAVRLKLVRDTDTFLVDQKGGVLRNGSAAGHLSESEFRRLKLLIYTGIPKVTPP